MKIFKDKSIIGLGLIINLTLFVIRIGNLLIEVYNTKQEYYRI